jgi:hypothetical protein
LATDTEKLRILLPHWMEHNAEHASEFRAWAERAGPAAEDFLAAANLVESANGSLASALAKLGGALADKHGHHHPHDHNDD